MVSSEDVEREIKVRKGSRAHGNRTTRDTWHFLRRHGQAYRTVRFTEVYKNDDPSQPCETEIRMMGWSHIRNLDDIDGPDKPDFEWFCKGDVEIELLRHAVATELPEARYRLVPVHSHADNLLDMLLGGSLSVGNVTRIFDALSERQDLFDALASTDLGKALSQAVRINQRREGLEKLRRLVADPSTGETAIDPVMRANLWIFGGSYFPTAIPARRITNVSHVDIPLIRGDGSLHIVELKSPNITKLIRNYDGRTAGQIIGRGIADGASQLMNYLYDVDSRELHVAKDHGVIASRASGVLVIGRSDDVVGFEKQEVLDTIRRYNSHLSRLEVLTYDQLLDSAARLLEFDGGIGPENSVPAQRNDQDEEDGGFPSYTPYGYDEEPPF